MKTKYLLLTITLIITAPTFAQSNLDRFKQEQEQSVKCPLNYDCERQIYAWLRNHLRNFDSLRVIHWSEPHGKRSFQITLRFSSQNGFGGMVTDDVTFTFNANGKLVFAL